MEDMDEKGKEKVTTNEKGELSMTKRFRQGMDGGQRPLAIRRGV